METSRKKNVLRSFFSPIMEVHLDFIMCVFDPKVASEWTFMVMTQNMAKSTEARVDDRIRVLSSVSLPALLITMYPDSAGPRGHTLQGSLNFW